MTAGRKNIFRDRWFWPAMVIGGFFLSLTLWHGSGVNQSVFSYGAWVWKHHHLPPYVGVWDPSFPGIFLVHRLALELFGPGFFGFRLFDFLVQLSSLGMIFYLSRSISNSGVAGFFGSVFYGIYYFGLGGLESGEREGFILWLLLLTMTLSLVLKERTRLRALLAGLLLGSSFTVQPFYGICSLFFGVWFFRRGPGNGKVTRRLELGLFLFSSLLPGLLIIFYYWRLGYLDQLFQAVVVFNFKMRGAGGFSVFGIQPKWALAVTIANYIFTAQPLAIFFAILAVLLPAKTPKCSEAGAFRTLVALVLTGLAAYLIQARHFPYHLTVFFGLLTVLSGAGLARVGAELKNSGAGFRGRVLPWLFYPAIALFMIIDIDPKAIDSAAVYCFRSLDRAHSAGNNFDAYYYRLAKQLRPVLSGESEIEYFSWQPLLPYLLEKKIPSRFCSVQYLLMRQKNGEISGLQRGWVKEYSASVIKARPRYFLVSGNVPRPEIYNLPGPSLKRALAEDFPELFDFLQKNYTFKTRLGEVEIYELAR